MSLQTCTHLSFCKNKILQECIYCNIPHFSFSGVNSKISSTPHCRALQIFSILYIISYHITKTRTIQFGNYIRSKNSQGPLPQGFADIKNHATNCLNRPFILREFFQNFFAGYFCYCQNGFSILRMNSFYPFESKLA